MLLRIAGITRDSIVDGPGLRMVVFTQGCPHHCLGCHNPQTHDPEGGKLMDTEEIFEMAMKAKLNRGITFSGGEPFLQANPVGQLAEKLKQNGFHIMTYTGFVFEQLWQKAISDSDVRNLLQHTDILVDGPYIELQRDLQLPFRGSRNQRLIDVSASLKAGQVVKWQEMVTVSNWA